MLHVDGSSNAHNGGAGILIQGPGVEIELDLAYEAGAKVLEVYTDSQLIAMQIEGSYETKEKTMAQYHRRAKMLMQQFDKCSIQQIPRCENDQADSVSKFGALLTRIKDRKVKVLIKEQPPINKVVEINTVESTCPWIEELAKYLRDGILPNDQARARKLKFRAPKFTLVGSQLYKRSIEGPLLKCLDDNQAKKLRQSFRSKVVGAETNQIGIFLADHAKRRKRACSKCENCQKHASQIHVPATPLQLIKITCPFDQWGIDILGPFPPAKAQKRFIVVAVEYFSKWKHIICRFGLARVLVSDNGTQFQAKRIAAWLKELKIQQNFTSVGHPQANGQTEVTNRTILQHLKAIIPSKGAWDEELPGTPFCLVYGSEAIIPAEIGEETLRITNYNPSTNNEARSFDIITIEEARERAYAKMLHHKGLMLRNYNKRVHPREFQIGDLVLKKVEVSKHVEKLDPTWEGPYKVVEIKRSGAYTLQDANGRELPRTWNIGNLRKFYV
ncbi:UNVERIFIED_CONTAM: Gag-Pol polyprotein [Sesamum indicum]